MDKKTYFLLLLLSMGLQAGRKAIIVNRLVEPISLKGPTTSGNKVAIPVTLNPGEAFVQDVEVQGSPIDSLVVTLLGHNSGLIRTFTKKYSKPTSMLIFINENDPAKDAQGFDAWQTDTFADAVVSQITSF
jgi:hypothetical protein